MFLTELKEDLDDADGLYRVFSQDESVKVKLTALKKQVYDLMARTQEPDVKVNVVELIRKLGSTSEDEKITKKFKKWLYDREDEAITYSFAYSPPEWRCP